MPTKGSASRAEGDATLRTVCAACGKAIPAASRACTPLDDDVGREIWGLVGYCHARTRGTKGQRMRHVAL
jgi:hypothetical protein